MGGLPNQLQAATDYRLQLTTERLQAATGVIRMKDMYYRATLNNINDD